MSTRTLEELKEALALALKSSDTDALLRYAAELEALETSEASAYSMLALGIVSRTRGDTKLAVEQLSRTCEAFVEVGDKDGLAKASNALGSAFLSNGEYADSLELYHRALSLFKEVGFKPGVANVFSNIGLVHFHTGNSKAALEHFSHALAVYEEVGDSDGVAMVNSNIGLVYVRTGSYPTALEYFHRAYTAQGELSVNKSTATFARHIGGLHLEIGNYSAALESFQRALDVSTALGNRGDAAQAMSNIGVVYSRSGKLADALEYYRRALPLHEELGQRHEVARVSVNIVATLTSLELYTEALTQLRSLDSLQIVDPRVVVLREHIRAQLYEQQGDLDLSATTLQNSLQISRDHSLAAEQAETHRLLRDLALRRNDLAQYVEHNNEYLRISEEIRGKEATQRLTMMEAERKIEAELRERDKERALLYGALPESVATRMLRGEDVTGDHYDNAAVLFLDIVGFTAISDQLAPAQVVQFLEQIFSSLDEICKKHELTKIKTIGDSYLAVAFPRSSPAARNDNAHLHSTAIAALEMLDAIAHIVSPNGTPVQVRLGVHCGAVTAGVLGKERLQYDVWGDTVNVASRMESTGEAGRIHVSEMFASLLSSRPSPLDHSNTSPPSPLSSLRGGTDPAPLDLERGGAEGAGVRYQTTKRGDVEIKGKGLMSTYWLEVP